MASPKPTNPALWSRVQAEAKRKFDVHPCVTEDVWAVSRSGPKFVGDLVVGDDILAYDMEYDALVWSPILAIQRFHDADIVNFYKATGFSVRCTPGHHWVREQATEDSTRGPHGRKASGRRRTLVKTSDINTNSQLVFCAMLNDGDARVPSDWAKHDDWTSRILTMSPAEREAFLAAAIVYDGCDQGAQTVRRGRRFQFTQKNLDHYYAGVLAAFCNGYYVSLHQKTPTIRGAIFTRGKRTHGTQNIRVTAAGLADVWCPTTAEGTWVMGNDNVIAITGNSAYSNAWASKEYKKRGGGWRGPDNRVKKGG